jgi:shikimate dehydrogenase
MNTSQAPARYAVMGYPIAHSKSPLIHEQFARQTGQNLIYSALEVAPGSFASRVKEFFSSGGAGLNVTVPFKQEAWELVDVRSALAESAGAVNTLFLDEEGRLHGSNTDGIGLVRDILLNHGGEIKDRRVLILGAGGAVRGVLAPIMQQQPRSLLIANRTLPRAELLAQRGREEGFDAAACDYEGLRLRADQGERFDLIINGTSSGLQGEMPPLPQSLVQADTWCYDMMYGSGDTVFQGWARGLGAARSLDGCGMLVEQAAEAFWLWRGVRPETSPVLQGLRDMLAKA